MLILGFGCWMATPFPAFNDHKFIILPSGLPGDVGSKFAISWTTLDSLSTFFLRSWCLDTPGYNIYIYYTMRKLLPQIKYWKQLSSSSTRSTKRYPLDDSAVRNCEYVPNMSYVLLLPSITFTLSPFFIRWVTYKWLAFLGHIVLSKECMYCCRSHCCVFGFMLLKYMPSITLYIYL